MTAVTVSPGPAPVLTEDGARAITAQLRSSLEDLQALLVRAYLGRVWAPLGYPTWQVYCSVELMGARLRMPQQQRRDVVGGLRRAGLSTRAIAAGIGASDQTVRKDLAATAEPPRLTVVGADGKTYSPSGRRLGGSPSPAVDPLPKTARAVLDLLAAGPDGLTWAELGALHGWHHGSSSGVLSALHRQGRIVRTTTYREGSAVYVLSPVGHPAPKSIPNTSGAVNSRE